MEIAVCLIISILLVTATVFLSLLTLFKAPRDGSQTGPRLISEGLLFYSFSFIFVSGIIGAIVPDIPAGFNEIGLAVAIFSFPILIQVGLGLYLVISGRIPMLHQKPFAKSLSRTLVVSFEAALCMIIFSLLLWRLIYYLVFKY